MRGLRQVLLGLLVPGITVGLTVALCGGPPLPSAPPIVRWFAAATSLALLPAALLFLLASASGQGRRALLGALAVGLLLAFGQVFWLVHTMNPGPRSWGMAELAGVEAAFLAVVAAGRGLELACGGRRLGGVLGLGAGLLLFFLPFMLDSWLMSPGDAGERRVEVERFLAASPPVVFAPAFLGHDLFKEESLYGRYRVGEQLVSTPSSAACRRRLLELALELGAAALVVAAGRALLRRRRSALMPAAPSQVEARNP